MPRTYRVESIRLPNADADPPAFFGCAEQIMTRCELIGRLSLAVLLASGAAHASGPAVVLVCQFLEQPDRHSSDGGPTLLFPRSTKTFIIDPSAGWKISESEYSIETEHVAWGPFLGGLTVSIDRYSGIATVSGVTRGGERFSQQSRPCDPEPRPDR